MDELLMHRYPSDEQPIPAMQYMDATAEDLLWLTLCGDKEAYDRLGIGLRYNQFHGKDGKFATKGGGATGSSPNISAEKADQLASMVKVEGGFTYDVNHNVHEEAGYSVSPYPNRSEEIPAAEFDGHSVEKYVDKNMDLLERQDHMLGAWHDRDAGTVWMDVTVVMFSKDAAVSMGKVFNQKAIFDLNKGVEIPTGGTGRSKRSLTPSKVERDVSHGGKACVECMGNTNPSNVPVHPGCQCNIETKEVGLGIDAEELFGLLQKHAASSMAGVALDDFPQSIALNEATAAVFPLNDFRFGDLVAWSQLTQDTGPFTVLLRDSENVALFKAMVGVGLYLYIAYDERDHDGAIIVGPDAGVEGLAQAYGLLQEGDQ